MRRALIAIITVLVATHGAVHAENAPGVVVGRGSPLWTTWRPPMLRIELGMLDQRTSLDAQADGAPTGSLPAGGAVTARTGTLRTLLGYLGVYFGLEFSLGSIREAPLVVAPTAARMGMVDDTRLRDVMFDVRVPLGYERRLGRVMLGGELASGVGGLTVAAGPAPDDPFVNDVRFVLDARARAGVWLTRHLSVSAVAGISLVRSEERAVGILLGGSLFPWDGTR